MIRKCWVVKIQNVILNHESRPNKLNPEQFYKIPDKLAVDLPDDLVLC